MRKIIFALIIFAIFIPQAAAQETVTLPELTGAYAVAKTMYHFETERDEIFTADAGDQRSVIVSLFYPAAIMSETEPAPYIDRVFGEDETLLGMPVATFDGIDAPVYRESPVAEGEFPVIIFSPGMGTVPLFYTALLAELASHGYIVVALWHPYSTEVVPDHYRGAVYANEVALVLPNPDTYAENAARVGAVWVADIITILDHLEQMNTDDNLFRQHIDLGHIGAIGHSFGGAAVLEAAAQDSRIDAVINMDGVPFGDSAANGINQPALFMGAEPFVYTDALKERGITEADFERRMALAEVPRRLIFATSQAGYLLVYRDALHNNFTSDFNLLAPADFFAPMIGSQGGARLVEVVNSYALTFFDQHVRGMETTWLDAPEITFESAD